MHLWYELNKKKKLVDVQRVKKIQFFCVIIIIHVLCTRKWWREERGLWKNNVSLSKRRMREVDLARDTFSSGFIAVNVWHEICCIIIYILCVLVCIQWHVTSRKAWSLWKYWIFVIFTEKISIDFAILNFLLEVDWRKRTGKVGFNKIMSNMAGGDASHIKMFVEPN